MKRFRVLYSAQAVDQLEALYLYIAEDTGPDRAAGYVDAIADYCDGLETFPHRGQRRDGIRPGLRLIGFRRRVTIAFTVEDVSVTILGVFYGGQDVEAALQAEDP
ncbi:MULTISPECIES: type II toxin-antitoxin system RelE/ParE family toxin [Inquilinus]|uniref:Plasmid stabilization system protein ParE n=1 Tax=Inquilinus ginsengisoli TaxID=363840 RepID=A0ABU1JKC1_9PROT|nr:type II toxin-antitoxin system RelE/ParE family toxin [Inquilinus ginsengisoli]MDR6289040.1 plasmid stabilization system protein ParE [Inquilinus ginsengisoli]